jgi:hypothetical protein
MKEYRVIDQGDTLTLGLVTYDPNGQPVIIDLSPLESETLSQLVNIVAQIKTATTRPILQLLGSGCEVICE